MSTLPAQLGPYAIDREIGRGGMGVVYLGHDTKLDRPVAIKALPEHLAQDPERLARFEREAKTLASLSHPNVAGVYGLEDCQGSRYLVMEYIEGESLAEIVARGPLAVDEAIRIAAQIASGVESAHEAGVIHRDLKPGNIVVSQRGEAKVLDFGLAKEVVTRGSSLDLSHSPTASYATAQSPATAQGQIMGTAAYVSPEQARGKLLDRRTDIWSFGCVLFEMLTGAGPFAGETTTDSFGAILHKEPDWSLLPAGTPPLVHVLLRRMLAKDPARRLRDIGDAQVELEEALRDPSGSSMALGSAALSGSTPGAGSRAGWMVAAVLAIIAAALGAMSVMTSDAPPANPMRLEIRLGASSRPGDEPGADFAIAPDGSTMVFTAEEEAGGELQLFVRRLDAIEASPISGTSGASQPTFSPDGQSVCFFADGKLKRIAITGGAPKTLCNAGSSPRGASWGDRGQIAFTPETTTGIWLVSEDGGESRQLTTLREDPDERSHRWPHFLPGSEAILFTSQTRGNDFDQGSIEAVTVADARRTLIHSGGSNPKFARSGHLVFGQAGFAFACRFDPQRLRATTSPVPVLEGIQTSPPNGGVEYSMSDTGMLVYLPGSAQGIQSQLTWIDREGQRPLIDSQEFAATIASLSPDGRRVALQIYTDGSDYDIWIYEIERQVLSRLTFAQGGEMNPIWSPDGARLAYAAIANGDPKIFVQAVDGSGGPMQITSGGFVDFPTSWSPDGKRIAFHRLVDGDEAFGLWTVELDSDGAVAEPEVFLSSQFQHRYPVFSPDGALLAYSNDETGRPEIYVRSFPRAGGRVQVSIAGGSHPVWSRDGSEIFFSWNSNVYACPIDSDEAGTLRVGRPAMLFPHVALDVFFYPQFDVNSTGDRFLALIREGESQQNEPATTLILNWFTELERSTGMRSR